MTEEGQTKPVADAEWLARFITERGRIRADGTVKQDAFIPPPDLQLSVTRHGNLDDEQLRKIGERVVQVISAKRSAGLYGRAGIVAGFARGLNLKVESAPDEWNPDHAHIMGWPADKPSQKIIAIQLAASAQVIRYQ